MPVRRLRIHPRGIEIDLEVEVTGPRDVPIRVGVSAAGAAVSDLELTALNRRVGAVVPN